MSLRRKIYRLPGAAFLRILAALGLAAPAAANADVRIPTGGWVVDFDDSQCVASLNFGTDAEPLILALKAPVAGEVIQIAVIRAGRAGRYADQLDAEIGIDDRPPVSTTMLAMRMRENDRRLYRVNLPLDQLGGVREARTLSIRGGDELGETFQLPAMASLLRVMDECVADLRNAWNGRESEDSPSVLATRARGSLEDVIRSSDYPGIAIDQDVEGTVAFALLIDETGRVADCTVTQTSGAAALDAQSCTIIIQRARFEPAVGLDGRPARDVYYRRIVWKIDRSRG